MRTYSPKKLSEQIGVTRVVIKDWISFGFVKASITRPYSYNGNIKHDFTDADVKKVRLFKELIDFGLSRKRASEIAWKAEPGFSISTGNFEIKYTPNQSLVCDAVARAASAG